MMCQMFTARSQQPHQEYSRQTMTHNVPSLSSQFSKVNQQPSTAFINQRFHSNLHVLQPVIHPSCSHPSLTSVSLSGEPSVFDHKCQ